MVDIARAEGDDLNDGLEYDVQNSEDEGELATSLQPPSEPAIISGETTTKSDQESNQRKRKKDFSNFQNKKKMKMELDIQQKRNMSLEQSPDRKSVV